MHEGTTVEKMLMAQAAKKRVPVNGSIELLPLCNMNCDMCYVRLTKEQMDSQGRLRTADEWIEIAKQMQEAGVLFLLLTGGEPFLYPEFKKVYLELQNMGFILTINTNATLIDEEWAVFLSQHKPRRINVTLYGADEETYTNLCHYPGGYKKAINGIKLLKKYEIDVKVGGSLTRENQNDIEKILDLGMELDVPVRIDTYMMPAIRERNMPYNLQSRVSPEKAAQIRIMALRKEMGEELFSQYLNQILQKIEEFQPSEGKTSMSCMAGKCSFTINWQGEMRPCVVLSSPAVSVIEHGFKYAWRIISEETNKIFINDQCGRCKLRPLCRTCAASALLENGSYDSIPEYMCKYAEESYRLLITLK